LFAFGRYYNMRGEDITAALSRLEIIPAVTRINALTEDGLSPEEGADILLRLRHLVGFSSGQTLTPGFESQS